MVNSQSPTKLGDTDITYSNVSQLFTPATGFISSFNYTLNPYRGCGFKCSYCYARYFTPDVNKIENWGFWVNVKKNSVELINQLLPGFLNGKTIYMSSVTDPYQPIEKKLNLSRNILNILATNHQPKLVVQTRSGFVSRDTDIFLKILENNGQCQVNMTVTTDHDAIRKHFEKYCPSIDARLREIKKLNEAGIQTCITLTPLLLLHDIDTFTQKLLDTGTTRFIAQPFHSAYDPAKAQIKGQTSDEAIDLMCHYLGITTTEFPTRYKEIYNWYETLLKQRLPNLAIGRAGFRPPF